MTALDYFFDADNGEIYSYRLIQFSAQGAWSILDGDELLGEMEKKDGEWIAITVNPFPAKNISEMGQLIDKQHYHTLPSEITSRWPKLVAEVIVKSDQEYMVICCPEINFPLFERMFKQFVPGMLQDEWLVVFKVYNSEFDQDFILNAKQAKEEVNFEPLKQWSV